MCNIEGDKIENVTRLIFSLFKANDVTATEGAAIAGIILSNSSKNLHNDTMNMVIKELETVSGNVDILRESIISELKKLEITLK